MIDIIKVELFRIKKSALFWVMLGLSAASPIISVLLNASALSLLGFAGQVSFNVLDALREAGMTASLLQQPAITSGDIALWSIIATAIVLSKEFTDGTMRNVMLANKKRTELYFAYLITSMIVAVTYLVAYLVVTLIAIAPIMGFQGATAGEVVSAIFCSLALGILTVAFTEACVCMFVFTVRKQWAAILFPLLVWYAPSVLNLIIGMANITIGGLGATVTHDYERWIPFYNAQLYNPLNIDGVVVGMNILYISIFTAAFVCIGLFTFKKADLK